MSVYSKPIVIPAPPTFGNPGPITICINGSYYLNPSTTSGTFSTLSSTIATVNSSGYVTGVSEGTTTVSLVTGGGTVSATITVSSNANPSLSITDPLAQPSYKFSNNPQGPIGGLNNYIGYNGYTYASQARPTNTGFFRASNQLGNEAGCPYEFYIFRCTTCGTVSDNNYLSSVTIGTQVWTDKNLDVTTYRNGDPIPQVTDATAWANLTTGAWSYYNDDPANGAIYGKLYNWYAVNDPRGLAPQGWHIPSISEWETLATSVGGPEDVLNNKLKAISSYWSPNTGNNTTGFSALPAGYRDASNGNYSGIGTMAAIWSLTLEVSSYPRYGLFDTGYFRSWYSYFKSGGLSVRLVKD